MGGGLFPGTAGVSDAKDVKFDNTEASLTGDPDDVQGAIEAVKGEINNISAGGLADIDLLPGDTVDDNKIDSSLINNATSTGLGVASFPNTTFTVSTAGAVSIKANVFQPYSAALADFSEGSPTGTYNLSGATITFGLERMILHSGHWLRMIFPTSPAPTRPQMLFSRLSRPLWMVQVS